MILTASRDAYVAAQGCRALSGLAQDEDPETESWMWSTVKRVPDQFDEILEGYEQPVREPLGQACNSFILRKFGSKQWLGRIVEADGSPTPELARLTGMALAKKP